MPGVMEIAHCECGYEKSVRHGITEGDWALLVVAYTKEYDDLVSVWHSDANWWGLEIIPYDNYYEKFLCPKCKQISLRFAKIGNWD